MFLFYLYFLIILLLILGYGEENKVMGVIVVFPLVSVCRVCSISIQVLSTRGSMIFVCVVRNMAHQTLVPLIALQGAFGCL